MNIERIVNELKKGNLVITPTDTVYGILADALNVDAVKKVYDAKNRDYSKPFIIYVSSISMLKEYTKNLSNLELELINKYMPGKLTIILNKNDKINDIVTKDTIGIRIPDNKDLIEIINRVGNPIITTSANISNKDTITNINMIEREMLDKISYIEDGGYINESPSTIIRVIDNKINILREGDLANIIRKDYDVD